MMTATVLALTKFYFWWWRCLPTEAFFASFCGFLALLAEALYLNFVTLLAVAAAAYLVISLFFTSVTMRGILSQPCHWQRRCWCLALCFASRWKFLFRLRFVSAGILLEAYRSPQPDNTTNHLSKWRLAPNSLCRSLITPTATLGGHVSLRRFYDGVSSTIALLFALFVM